jgi:hypothetical protein
MRQLGVLPHQRKRFNSVKHSNMVNVIAPTS